MDIASVTWWFSGCGRCGQLPVTRGEVGLIRVNIPGDSPCVYLSVQKGFLNHLSRRLRCSFLGVFVQRERERGGGGGEVFGFLPCISTSTLLPFCLISQTLFLFSLLTSFVPVLKRPASHLSPNFSLFALQDDVF